MISESCDVTVYEDEAALDRQELLTSVRETEGLVCIPRDSIDAELLDAAPLLKVISTCSVGYEHIDVAEATKRGIYVGYTPEVLTAATADFTFAVLLAAARRIAEGDRYVRAGKWHGRFDFMTMLGKPVWEATLGIIGFGRIGQAVATRAGGFRMKVLYHDVLRQQAAEERRLGVEYHSFDDLLGESDFVTIHVPYS
jgi:glyoxylate reductase